jgi:tRNA modification GTPase
MNKTIDSNTIAAISTGKGTGAIAGIRVSGKNAFSIVSNLLDTPGKFDTSECNKICIFNIVSPDTKTKIDQITAVKYKAPNSFTGEDVVEIFCHGGEYIVEKILSMIINEGAVPAGRGEFSRRAFLNGKIDLIQAEAILGLIESRTERTHEAAVNAYFGKSKEMILRWKKAVQDVLKDLEAEIEFPEEGDIKNNKFNHNEKISKIIKEIEMDINKNKKIKIIEKGISVPVVGIPNAGKSSLFNMLLEYNRTIVHYEEGTTRDVVGEQILICGEKIHLLDTAGLRETENKVEKMGIEKTMEAIRGASVVVWVTPANSDLTFHEKELIAKKTNGMVLCLISKIDLAQGKEKIEYCKNNNIPAHTACLLDGEERKRLIDFISGKIKKHLEEIEPSDVIRTARHEYVARRILGKLVSAKEKITAGEEITAHYLKSVLDDLSEFVGETTSDDILNSIFSKFCIGK